MQMRYVLALFLLFSYCFGPAGTAKANNLPPKTDVSSSESGPHVSTMARRMNLAGTVKVFAVVAADGT